MFATPKDILEITTENTEFIIAGKNLNGNRRLALHKVKKGKVLAETSFSEESAKAIFSVFNSYEFQPLQFKGIIDNDIIYARSTAEQTKLIFKVKSGIRKLYYADNSQLDTDNYHVPNLIFLYDNKKVKVFSYLGKLNDNTTLNQAPFFNVYDSGNICFGNVSFELADKLGTFDALKDYITNNFFNSVFTHSNSNEINVSYLKTIKNISLYKSNDLFPIYKDKKQKEYLTLKDLI